MCLISAADSTGLLKESIHVSSKPSCALQLAKGWCEELTLESCLHSSIKHIIGLDSSSTARARTKGKLILDLNNENLNGAWRKEIIVPALLLHGWLWESMTRSRDGSRHRQKQHWLVLIWHTIAGLSSAVHRISFSQCLDFTIFSF